MKTYKEHYEECQKAYEVSNTSVYGLTIVKDCLSFDKENFRNMAKEIKERLDDKIGCIEDEWAVKLNEWEDIIFLTEFCQEVMPQIEEKFFGSYLAVEFVHPYRVKSMATKESSWSWHYDDCPKEFIKLAIYLNDVGEYNGCMQVVLGPNNTIPVIDTYRLDPSAIKGFPPPVFPKTRIPQDVLKEIRTAGGRFYSIVGQKGTHFVFTPNVMHRGTIPVEGLEPRDAIFFYLRPVLKKMKSYTDRAGSFLSEGNVKKYELD